MSLSPEAQVLRDLLSRWPGALAELLLDERQEAREPAPESPALSAVRALSPWEPTDPEAPSYGRRDLASGLIVALAVQREHLRHWCSLRVMGGPWVGLLWDYLDSSEPACCLAGTAGSREGAAALADALLVLPERRWRLM